MALVVDPGVPVAVLDRFSSAGLSLAAGVTGVAFLLILWQIYDERRWQPEAGRPVSEHERSQSRRRRAVAAIMLLNALLIVVGIIVPHELEGRPNLVFVGIWVTVFLLVIALLVLAMIDWLATRRFALQARAAMSREGLAILRDELERRAAVRRERLASQGSDDDSPRAEWEPEVPGPRPSDN
ncbi:MAG: hypothetical protein U0794_18455 [Isosphaeraceae bacterium]